MTVIYAGPPVRELFHPKEDERDERECQSSANSSKRMATGSSKGKVSKKGSSNREKYS